MNSTKDTESLVLIQEIREFIHNEREPFPGAGFTIKDDVWDLSYRETRAIHESNSKLRFEVFQEWLKPTIKEFMAWSWLYEDLSNSTLSKYMEGLRCFNSYLIDYREAIKSVFHFENSVKLGFIQFMKTEVQSDNSKNFIYGAIKKYSEFLQKNYPEEMNREFYLEKGKYTRTAVRKQTYYQEDEKTVPLDVCYKIMNSVKEEEEGLFKVIESGSNVNNQLNNAKNRLVYCQILKMIIATGRRSSHIINLDRNPLRKSRENEAKGVWVSWNETKTKQGYQEVFVPEPLSDVVIEAVDIAKTITSELVNKADEDDKNSLFLVYGHPKNGGNHIRVPEYKNVVSFINGRKDRQGFMKRHNIKHQNEIYYLKMHGFRHTRFTQMRLGGAGIGTIQNDAKHVTTNMTAIYVDGSEVARKEFFEAIDKDELHGDMVEFIKNKNVRMEKFSQQELERYRKNGMFVQLTHYGYCHLEIEIGPCPSGDPCWIGTDGCGCKYHLYTPESLEAIEDDVALYRKDLEREEESSPGSPLIGHYKSILARYEEVKEQVKKKE